MGKERPWEAVERHNKDRKLRARRDRASETSRKGCFKCRRDRDKFVVTGDDAYLKAVAYHLHGFYTGLERIFQSVADTIDDKLNALPNG